MGWWQNTCSEPCAHIKGVATASRLDRMAAPLVLGMGLSLLILLVPVRLHVIGYTVDMISKPFLYGTEMLIAASYEVTFITAVTAAFLVVLLLTRRWISLRRWVYRLYLVAATIILLACLANVEVMNMLGHPLNYAWLYYADFLQSAEAKSAISASLSWKVIGIGVGFWAVWYGLGRVLAMLMACSGQWVSQREVVCLALPSLVVYLTFSHWYLLTEHWNWDRLANPIHYFSRSLLASADAPRLLTMHTPVGPQDFQAGGERSTSRELASFRRATPDVRPPRNVILFVLESTGAVYLDLYGSPYAITPELARYSDRAIVFDNAYASVPATAQSALSLLCSAYPSLSYYSVTAETPDTPLASISALFDEQGYSNAFFSTGYLEFQSLDQFLSYRGFAHIEDPDDRPAKDRALVAESRDASGSTELDAVASVISWIDQQGDQPFFMTYWSLQAHYPYFVVGDAVDYGTGNVEFERYLNGIRQTDAAFGKLMRHLEARGLLDSTLVVVVGDHGDAFGQHGPSKGRRLYEENLRVPMMFIHPGTFAGARDTRLTSLIDVAPSILHLLGMDAHPLWQGRSVFSDDRTDRAYFFAPWSGWLFGFREGDMKLVMNVETGDREVYNLANDPQEKHNLLGSSADFVETAEQRLAAWAQYQHAYYKRLSEQSPLPKPDRGTTVKSAAVNQAR